MRQVLGALAVAAGLSIAAPASAAVGFDQGMVSITIDDGWSSPWTYARGMLNQRGIKSTYYIVTDAVAQGWVGFLTLPQLRTLVTDGNEIGSHTLTHPDLTTVSDTELQRQLSQSKSWLLGNAGVSSVPEFASPFGAYDTRITNAIKLLYASHRTVVPQQNWQDSDPYELGAFDCYNGITVAQVKSWIDQAVAQRSWLILLFHEFTPGAPVRSTDIRNSDFAAILDYLHPVKTVTVAQGRALMHPAAPPPPVVGLPIYHDALESGFQDWSWATHDLFQSAVVRTGPRAASFEPDGWAGLDFHHPTPIDTTLYTGLDFWVNGGPSGNQAVNVRLFLGSLEKGSALLSDLLGTPVAPNKWQHVFLPFASLGISGGFDDLYLQDWSGLNQGKIFIDDMRLVPK
jgi:peptidoglycan/xylan/chitin deacetylase (PgdA/CDA1 family)